MATVEVSFVYLKAAPTHDTLSSNPFYYGYPIELNATDEVHELSRQIMADYDVVDATVYQPKTPAEYTSVQLYKQLKDSPRGVLHDIAKQIPTSRIIEHVLNAGGSEQTLIVVLGAPATVKVRFFYLDAAPTRDTLLSNPFHRADPIILSSTDEVHDLSRQIMARYDVVDATVYQHKRPAEYTSDELYKQLEDSPRGVLEDIANVIRPSRIIRDLLQPGSAPQTFIVLLRGRGPSPPMGAEPEVEVPGAYQYTELALFLKEFQEETPSQLVQSWESEYSRSQGSSTGISIYDGRTKEGKPATVALPIELYHPVFLEFGRCAHDESIVVPNDILQLTAKLMCTVSATEAPGDNETREIMEDILGVVLEHATDEIGTSSDYISQVQGSLGAATPLVVEVKGDSGFGGDPSVQAAFCYTKYWVMDHDNCGQTLNACCCPSFVVGVAGSWLVIEGAVMTSRTIIQRLTPYMSLEFSQLLGDRQVYTVARHLYALKRGVEELSEFYRTLTAPQVTPTFIHPRFCPYLTSFVNADGVKVTFQYVRPFERYVGCVIFEAKLSTQDSHVVVKFVREYGRDAHAHMAQAGYAPMLIHFGELGDGYEDLALVVMEYVDGPTLADAFGVYKPLPADVHADVRKALSVLNGGGYVFGDLRRQNIMQAKHRRNKEDTRIRFIDFDWAGKAGEVRYPAHVSPVILGAAGAKAFEPILQKHQDGLFKVL